MSGAVSVRRLTPEDAPAYRALRLRALLAHPEAFASSHDEESALPLAEFERMLAARDDGAIFGGEVECALVALAGVQRESMKKLAHKAVLWGMYVAPEARRTGVGERVIRHALRFAVDVLGVQRVNLGVNTRNEAALALYRKVGFETYGTERGFLLVDGVSHDEHQMVWVADTEVVFRTTRLIARRLDAADVAAMHAVYGDAEAMRYVGEGRALDRAQCEHWVEVTQRNYAARGYGMFALVSRASGAVVGFCGLVHPGGQEEAEIKYAFLRECWGQGLATEAATALLAAAASRFGLRRVIATTDAEHVASHKVLAKAGMVPAPVRIEEDGSETWVFQWEAARAT